MADSSSDQAELQGIDSLLYQIVATRRLQFDNLTWQVPIISLTGQAFLFTIALSSGNSETARIMAAVLAFFASVLCMALMSRHRIGELTDAQWQSEYEEANFGITFAGETWRKARDNRACKYSLARTYGYYSWMFGLGLFAAAALATIVIAACYPNLLAPPQ